MGILFCERSFLFNRVTVPYNPLLPVYKYTGAPLPPFQLSSPQASPVNTATTEAIICLPFPGTTVKLKVNMERRPRCSGPSFDARVTWAEHLGERVKEY